VTTHGRVGVGILWKSSFTVQYHGKHLKNLTALLYSLSIFVMTLNTVNDISI